ncbi:MAG: nitrophenyl compound nitroreductase subunit ArsF family protein [Candidatus Nanoarchaeia archaeon]|nr:nitrophenyl compound nitroreductase subunit ArsF family protein [Candidatus Nanoarchaeia archaeon]
MAVKMKVKYETIMILMLLTLGLLSGCSNETKKEDRTGNDVNRLSDSERDIAIEKLEIYHFHGTNQCYSCITVGDYAEETLNTYFKDELEKGIIVFDHINGELPENKDLVMKYGATGSSLWIGVYNDGNFTAEQNVQVWYKIKDKQDYMNYLKRVIEQKLKGN